MKAFKASCAIFIFLFKILSCETIDYNPSNTAPFGTSINRRKRDTPKLPDEGISSKAEDPNDKDFFNLMGIDKNKVKLPVSDSNIREEEYDYYSMKLLPPSDKSKAYYVDLDAVKNKSQVVSHEILSNSHLKASLIKFGERNGKPWEFPYYGHLLTNVTVATGGFVYTGKTDHTWIAATQYIAPLMAGFNPSIHNDSVIRVYDNGTAYTVEWKNIIMHGDKDNHTIAGNWTFQLTMHKNGDIVFYYKNLPYPIANVTDSSHPLKIGLADAYLVERQWFIFRRRTIFEYDRIHLLNDLNASDIQNGTAIIFRAKTTCLSFTNCESCLRSLDSESGKKIPFGCKWCHAANRCSDGVDRYYQDWSENQCSKLARNDSCEAPPPPPAPAKIEEAPLNDAHKSTGRPSSPPTSSTTKRSTTPSTTTASTTRSTTPSTTTTTTARSTTKSMMHSHGNDDSDVVRPPQPENGAPRVAHSVASTTETDKQFYEDFGDSGVSPVTILALLVVLASVVAIGGWIAYAYRNPASSSGQFLIRYRPKNWTRNNEGESSNPHIRI